MKQSQMYFLGLVISLAGKVTYMAWICLFFYFFNFIKEFNNN